MSSKRMAIEHRLFCLRPEGLGRTNNCIPGDTRRREQKAACRVSPENEVTQREFRTALVNYRRAALRTRDAIQWAIFLIYAVLVVVGPVTW